MKIIIKIIDWYKDSAIRYFFSHDSIGPDDAIMSFFSMFIGFMWMTILIWFPSSVASIFIVITLNAPININLMLITIWFLGIPYAIKTWFRIYEGYYNETKHLRGKK